MKIFSGFGVINVISAVQSGTAVIIIDNAAVLINKPPPLIGIGIRVGGKEYISGRGRGFAR